MIWGQAGLLTLPKRYARRWISISLPPMCLKVENHPVTWIFRLYFEDNQDLSK